MVFLKLGLPLNKNKILFLTLKSLVLWDPTTATLKQGHNVAMPCLSVNVPARQQSEVNGVKLVTSAQVMSVLCWGVKSKSLK